MFLIVRNSLIALLHFLKERFRHLDFFAIFKGQLRGNTTGHARFRFIYSQERLDRLADVVAFFSTIVTSLKNTASLVSNVLETEITAPAPCVVPVAVPAVSSCYL